jgi:hypothetical protein
VLHNICQHFRIPWPDPDINEEENGGIYNFQTIIVNNAQIYFSFKDKGKEMRLQIHSLIGKKKKTNKHY